MLMFGLRLGKDPRVVVTTTPKPIKIIRDLIADPTTVITRGSTYDNRANLAPAFMAQIIKKYEGTRVRPNNATRLSGIDWLWSAKRA
jgi:phage terminase large subunit-like protein